MLKKSPRTESDAVWDRKIGAALAFIRNRDAQQGQAVFAKRMGISRSHLSNIESGRTPLTVSVGWSACQKFDIHPTWLCTAGNSNKAFFPLIPDDRLKIIEAHLRAAGSAPLRAIWPNLASYAEGGNVDAEEKSALTSKAYSLTSNDMQPVLPKLIQRLKRATEGRGRKSELAAWLGVHRQCVTDWLSGKQEPGGEITLKLLRWVEQQERQK